MRHRAAARLDPRVRRQPQLDRLAPLRHRSLPGCGSSATSSVAPGIARRSSSAATLSPAPPRRRRARAELLRRAWPARAVGLARAPPRARRGAPRRPRAARSRRGSARRGRAPTRSRRRACASGGRSLEPLLDRGERAGVGIDRSSVGAQLARQVAELDRERREPGSASASSRGSTPATAAAATRPAAIAPAAPASSPSPPPASAAARPGRRLAQPLRVAQPLALGGKLLGLVRVGRDRLDLRRARSGTGRGRARATRRARAARRARRSSRSASRWAARYALAQRQVLGAGEAVEDLQPGPRRSSACGARAGRRRRAAGRRAASGRRPRRRARRRRRWCARRPRPGGRARSPRAGGKPRGELGHLRLVEQARRAGRRALHPGLLGARAGRSAAGPCRPSAGRASGRGSSCPPRSRR